MKPFRTVAVLVALALIAVYAIPRGDLEVFADGCEGELVKQDGAIVTVELEPGVYGPAPIINGDVNADGTRDITDAVFLLSHLFLGGPEPPPLVAVECVGTVTGEACIRFYNEVTCNSSGFSASLTLTECGTDPITTTTGNWSPCVCVPVVNCQPCIRAVTSCGTINVCGELNMVPGTVYSFVLMFDGTQPKALLLDDPGDCSTPVPGGAGGGAALLASGARVFGVADPDLQGFGPAE